MNINSLDDLLLSIQKNNNHQYLFFWGHSTSGNSITKSCFSQWYPSAFIVDDITYVTAEHFMMAEKARLFLDAETEKKILSAKDPSAAKAYGRQVKGFDQNIWVEKCFDIVVQGNLAKFSQNPELNKFLLATGNKVLVEASPVDSIWGIGLSENDSESKNPRQWKGKNLLGFALMNVREKLYG